MNQSDAVPALTAVLNMLNMLRAPRFSVPCAWQWDADTLRSLAEPLGSDSLFPRPDWFLSPASGIPDPPNFSSAPRPPEEQHKYNTAIMKQINTVDVTFSTEWTMALR